jgi:hypothetical protein
MCWKISVTVKANVQLSKVMSDTAMPRTLLGKISDIISLAWTGLISIGDTLFAYNATLRENQGIAPSPLEKKVMYNSTAASAILPGGCPLWSTR